MKNVINVVKETAEEAMHTTPLEKALYNTTSNLSSIPAISDMEIIADHTNDHEDSRIITKYINKKLKKDNNKRILVRVASANEGARSGGVPAQKRGHAHRARNQGRKAHDQGAAEHNGAG
jgi:hypothetical protein